ncbi:MAG TPA: DUF6519 domain-containing protein [Candidatus Binatia bacterium]|jgi:hypothetical protein
MGGDYSRERFDAANDFHGILQQQGRVQLDANWNEWVKIVDRRFRTETSDIIGRCAVPRETSDGFLIQIAGTNLTIGRGRIYVDGLLAENHGKAPREFDPVLAEERGTAALPYEEQPYFPNAANSVPREGGPYLVYLDVWEREVTHLQKPDLIEQAVGVDTVTALQTVWQVRPLANIGAGVTCATPDEQIPGWPGLTRPSAGRLTTKLVAAPDDKDPCLIPPGSGFRALENQLYRIEIHNGGPVENPTFKWSRDNGSVATNVVAIAGADLTVARVGRDAVLRFNPGDWVEITDDRREMDGRSGEMRKVINVTDATQIIKLDKALPAADFPAGNIDANRHVRIRRWDQKGKVLDGNGNTIVDLDATSSTGVIPVPAAGTAVVFEGGVQVTFDLDPAGGEFHVADYWTFAGRPVDGTIETLDKAPPRGVHHHYCRLALVTFPNTVSDCRPLWPPVTEPPGAATERGIHIKDVLIAGGALRNDIEVPVAQVARGITVVCDTAVDRGSLRGKPTCFVTLDMPYPFNRADMELWGGDIHPVIGFQPLILAAEVDAEGQDIFWRPSRETHDWLVDRLLPTMKRFGRGDRVLAHLTLKGNFIWDQENPERPALYLDGEAFGFRRAGAANTDIRLPSGNGRRGGDFEMWFWLVREERRIPIELVSIALEPDVVPAGRSSRGTVTLSGAAPAGGAVVRLSSANNAAATVPESITVEEGNTTASFEVRTNPAAAREPAQVAITASLGGASRAATLTVQNAARLLKVRRVRILDTSDAPSNPNARALANMENPRIPLRVAAQSRPNAIEVQFTDEARVDFESVVSGKTFIVSNEREPDRSLPGQIIRIPASNSARWVSTPPQPLPSGNYRVLLKGDGDPAIRSDERRRLDGEPQQLPSGDDVEGGDFVFQLRVDVG